MIQSAMGMAVPYFVMRIYNYYYILLRSRCFVSESRGPLLWVLFFLGALTTATLEWCLIAGPLVAVPLLRA